MEMRYGEMDHIYMIRKVLLSVPVFSHFSVTKMWYAYLLLLSCWS